jgi:hypothetical protein
MQMALRRDQTVRNAVPPYDRRAHTTTCAGTADEAAQARDLSRITTLAA